MFERVAPEFSIRCVTRADIGHMLGDVTAIGEQTSQCRGQLRVYEEAHELRSEHDRVVGLLRT